MSLDVYKRQADSVIIDVAIKPLSTIPGIHSLSPRLYDEIVDGITNAFGQKNLPGINVKHRKGFIEINVYIRCLYGYNAVSYTHLDVYKRQLQGEQVLLKDYSFYFLHHSYRVAL